MEYLDDIYREYLSDFKTRKFYMRCLWTVNKY
jgi:hypothetical protein